MSNDKKNNAAANQAAVLKENTDTVTTEVINPEGSTVESTDKSTAKELEIIFLLSPTGAYGLAYNVGEKAFFPELQAKELVESAYAEFV